MYNGDKKLKSIKIIWKDDYYNKWFTKVIKYNVNP